MKNTPAEAINADDSLMPLSATAERDGRSDTCWIEITDDGRYVYTASFQTGDISSYVVEPDGRLVLLNPAAARVNAPLPGAFDLALVDSNFLYGLDTNLGTVVAFRIDSAGGLTEIDRENLGSLGRSASPPPEPSDALHLSRSPCERRRQRRCSTPTPTTKGQTWLLSPR
ncbi:MAG: hypothetical protein ACR2HY_00435 [Acidimicrobiales bacterium]